MDGDDEIPLGKGPHNDRRLSMEAFGKVDKDSFYGFEEFRAMVCRWYCCCCQANQRSQRVKFVAFLSLQHKHTHTRGFSA